MSPMQKTSVKAPAMTTSGPDQDEEVVEDVWYWMMLTPAGKQITKKVTTDQVRTAIKAGHMDAEAQLSKKPTGFRAAGTFPEFQAIFKSQKIATKANVKGAKNRDKFREIEEEDAPPQVWLDLTHVQELRQHDLRPVVDRLDPRHRRRRRVLRLQVHAIEWLELV